MLNLFLVKGKTNAVKKFQCNSKKILLKMENISPNSSSNKKLSLICLRLKFVNRMLALSSILTENFGEETFCGNFPFIPTKVFHKSCLGKKLGAMKKPLRKRPYIVFHDFCMVLFSCQKASTSNSIYIFKCKSFSVKKGLTV